MSEDQRTAQQWTVKVDGTELKKLESGESVEIGRKPLRPLVDDGFARLDIMDASKSMSKRHAIFQSMRRAMLPCVISSRPMVRLWWPTMAN